MPAGEKTIRHLLSRGTHREFGYAALAVMLVFYFCGAVWAAGSAIASGLFVPMLLIGSCVGRLVGLAAVDIAAHHGYGTDGYACHMLGRCGAGYAVQACWLAGSATHVNCGRAVAQMLL